MSEVWTQEESALRAQESWAEVPADLERLAEQCCDEFHGEIGTFRDSIESVRHRWREFAKFLLGAMLEGGGGGAGREKNSPADRIRLGRLEAKLMPSSSVEGKLSPLLVDLRDLILGDAVVSVMTAAPALVRLARADLELRKAIRDRSSLTRALYLQHPDKKLDTDEELSLARAYVRVGDALRGRRAAMEAFEL